MTYQQITIVGNVGRDPELKYTQTGTAVTDFSLAVNSSYKTAAGEQVDRTTWYRITCWGKVAEIVSRYVKKGKQVLVIGDRIEANAYTGKDGEARASLDVTANTVRFLGNKNDNGASDNAPEYNANDISPDGEEIPF
jgi:single-strand DNA-binding protein